MLRLQLITYKFRIILQFRSILLLHESEPKHPQEVNMLKYT